MAQRSSKETIDVDMEYVTINDSNNQLEYNVNSYQYHHNLHGNSYKNQHPPRQTKSEKGPTTTIAGTTAQFSNNVVMQYPPPPPSGTAPTRSESGESQRSQTRRFGQGHAEMQRSAFLSSPTEQQVGLKKMKAEVAAMDSSGMFQEIQPQKKPRHKENDYDDD